MRCKGPLLWAICAVLLPQWLASAAEGAERCLDDGDCEGLLLCRESRCVPVHCRRDAQCPAGRMCRQELCRIRQCYTQRDCPVDTRCEQGLCVLPQPIAVRRLRRGEAWYGRLDGFRLLLGPVFPSGLIAQCDVPIGPSRWVSVGAGSTLDSGGFAWKLGVRGSPMTTGGLSLDVWAGVNGQAAAALDEGGGLPPGEPAEATALGLLSGSGRFLFAADRPVNALWWGGGGGLSWRHGAANRHLLRLDAGALMLYNDRYPARRDFALLPSLSLQWGLAF